jgi:DNA-directed RNA polymerase subunit RPC12/RpoP
LPSDCCKDYVIKRGMLSNLGVSGDKGARGARCTRCGSRVSHWLINLTGKLFLVAVKSVEPWRENARNSTDVVNVFSISYINNQNIYYCWAH